MSARSRPPAFVSGRRRFLGVLGAGAVVAGVGGVAAVSRIRSAARVPAVIPALAQWTAGSADFTLGRTPRIVVASGALARTATLLAADVRALTGVHATVATGSPDDGDIRLSWDRGLPARAYRLDVRGVLTVSGATDAAVFHGTRTVAQLLRQGRTVPGGSGTDAPAYPERGVVLDVARKYYSVDFLKWLIRELAWLKYTSLHLHLTDTQAYRIECAGRPDVVAARHYTRREMAELVSYAADRHVTVVPEIDMPGHMNPILRRYPELALRRANGYLSLDLSQWDAACGLARSFLDEYLELFPGPEWSIGADEWLSTADLAAFPQLESAARSRFGPDAGARDLEYGFVNWLGDHLRAHGRRPRIWNDQLVPDGTVAVDRTVTIDHWYGSAAPTAADLDAQGYSLVNCNSDVLYGDTDNDAYPDPATIYEEFAVHRFSGGQRIPADSPRLRGAQLAIWSDTDNDVTERHVADRIGDPLRALAQIAWGSRKPAATYDRFARLVATVGSPP
ncbi:family 20 glycosylhydrolase [Actinocatenispora rupis]|uniref:family 20 glycosylhydrolase n=1 Tax=Actinocatenispora rupis TaxID=519421 RepID=UPI001943DBD3|nr:family 20 glycosylhydrolase [Actinocatenispora rupis]